MQQLGPLGLSGAGSLDFAATAQPTPVMQLLEPGGGQYRIPLTGSQPLHWLTRDAADPAPELLATPNIFMPVRLLRLKSDGTTEPLRSGTWLYVFQNGYLWREIRIPGGRQLYQLDVNLAEFAGQDQRPARCLGSEHLTLAYRVNGLTPEYRLAYSETQWSWAQIQALGGLHPEDPRNPSSEDGQTPDTLAALEQRTSLLPLTDADLLQSRFQVLIGSSQSVVAAEPQVDPDDLTVPHLLITDPLQDARDLKARQDELIALQQAGLQSLQTGQLGLARMIRDLTENGDKLKLAQHLAPARNDQQLLDAWQQLEDQLPGWLEAAEQQLLHHLQTPAFTLAIADQLQADDLLTSACGLAQFTQLTHHLVAPESQSWLWHIHDEDQTDEHPACQAVRGQKPELNAWLVHRTNPEAPLPDQEDERLRGLDWPDRLQLISLLPSTLYNTIGKYSELATAQDAKNIQQVMEKIGQRFERFTQLAIKVETTTLRQWLPQASLTARNGYRYLNGQFTSALQKLGDITVPQLVPKDRTFDNVMRQLNTSPVAQGTLVPLLGILMVINAYFAGTAATNHNWRSMEHNLAAVSASTSFLVLLMEQAHKWTPQPIDIQTKPETQLAGAVDRQAISKKWGRQFVHGKLFGYFLRGLIIGGAVLGTAQGIWQAIRGLRTGNTGIVAAGGVLTLSSLLMLASGLVAMKGVLALMALTPFTAALLGLGLLAISVIIAIFSEHAQMEQIIRHGWFGSHPYAKSVPGLQRPTGLDLKAVQNDLLQHLQTINPQALTLWPSAEPELAGELQAITRQLFHFTTEIKVYNLNEQFMVAMDQPTPRQRPIRIVELHVKLGAFAPTNTLLQGKLTISNREYDLTDCYVVEQRPETPQDTLSPPQELRFLLQVHENETLGQIRAQAWVDPDGTGQLQIPEKPQTCRWKGRTLGNMDRHDWQRLQDIATQKPLGQHQDTILVEQDHGCRLVPREQALLYPLLSWSAS